VEVLVVRRSLAWVVIAACAAEPPQRAPLLSEVSAQRTEQVVGQHELVERLARHGFTISQPSDGDTLACRHAGACACVHELPCHANCTTYVSQLAVFKKALAGQLGDRTVECGYAETGTLCGNFYFRFVSIEGRVEELYFRDAGPLIGRVSVERHDDYCGAQTQVEIAGALPDCDQPAQNVEVICNDHRRAVAPIPGRLDGRIDDLAH
jgi:hypothetical protein